MPTTQNPRPLPAVPGRPGRPRRLTERELERRFFHLVRSVLRGRVTKLAPTEKGTPDRLVLLPGGRVYLVELKTEVGRLSPAQRLWHDRAAVLGTPVAVLYGLDGIEEWVAARLSERS